MISIVSAEKNVFTATGELFDGCMEWSDENAVKLYTSIVLRDIKTNVLPDRVLPECPQLKLFSVRADHQESSSLTIPNNFFEKMIQVRVINLTYMNLLPLPSSLGLLSNLRTLSLCYCKLLDISVTGELKKLEILCLRCSDIQQLPVELGQLTWLKLLDLRDCSKLEVIPPNILSNLSHLEDLNIGDNSFDKWDVEVDGVKNASLDELKHLTSLELQIRDVNGLPRGLFFEKLERYRILIGDSWNWKYNICSRDFRIELNSKISLKDGLSVQLQGIEHLGLYGLQEQDVHNFVNEPVKVGSSQLKHLWIEGCDDALNPAELKRQEESLNDIQSNEIILEDNVSISNALFIEKVALPKLENLELRSINVERIWQNQFSAISSGVQNLMHLTLYRCRNLRCLFSSSIVSNDIFVRLQHLEILGCPVLEEIITVDQEKRNNNIVMFPQLQYLKMYDLKKLSSFCTGDVNIIKFPSLKKLWISRCPEFMLFPNLEELRADAKHIATNNSLFPEDLICKLKCLEAEFGAESPTIFSLDDFLQRFHAMKVLRIGGGRDAQEAKEKAENGMESLLKNFSTSNFALVAVVIADEDDDDASAILFISNDQFLQQLFTLKKQPL
ncbi:hypothetical protein WN944_007281 [Citrus x changshan-huyou]|uniref:Disease resistance protein At4g27190-like leucine-rich repeats domain-containing protein n=1 Tax=Citrus x changshan-huyou TaxID=2935761 RepID=A0AAP0MMM8_9ROSI